MGLERAREILDSDSVTFAFYYIIDEWLEMNSDKSELPPIEEKIRVLEKIYGVKLIIQRNEGA